MEYIGGKYLASIPEDELNEYLYSGFLREIEALELGLYSVSETKDRIKGKILSDFKTNRIVYVDNWMMSRTEVNMCAWIYLENNG